MNAPIITVMLAGAKVTIRAKLRPFAASLPPLRIGETSSDGGIFMGIVRGENGAPDYRLYDLGEADKRLPWAEAMKWAEEKGGSLPTRREQAVMFGNRGEGQYKSKWYWSCEQDAGDESCVWVQYFDGGYQGSGRKSGDYCARAVRRV